MTRIDEFNHTAWEAEQYPCPRCGAPAGTTCRNTITGNPLRGPAHWQRIQQTTQHQTGELDAARRRISGEAIR
ncbi:zinc finger domain-containing protein [Sciscionella sediminilitoris]|uniref:zinc finger domain-containing protein n=1 Tax=Sciscionella sediminilitoris TaxID=1445613 RepID=UPI0004DF0D11|nr:hypothetical protein [Sciscionella sp. SE31]